MISEITLGGITRTIETILYKNGSISVFNNEVWAAPILGKLSHLEKRVSSIKEGERYIDNSGIIKYKKRLIAPSSEYHRLKELKNKSRETIRFMRGCHKYMICDLEGYLTGIEGRIEGRVKSIRQCKDAINSVIK